MNPIFLALTVSLLGVTSAFPQDQALIPPSPSANQPTYENFTTTTPYSFILAQFDNNNPDGSFNYSYDTSNGIRQDTSGYIKKQFFPILDKNGKTTGKDTEIDSLVQVGSYSYYDPNGVFVNISYIADENGFQAFGNSIPTPPPIPEEILLSLHQHENHVNYTDEILAHNGYTATFENTTVKLAATVVPTTLPPTTLPPTTLPPTTFSQTTLPPTTLPVEN